MPWSVKCNTDACVFSDFSNFFKKHFIVVFHLITGLHSFLHSCKDYCTTTRTSLVIVAVIIVVKNRIYYHKSHYITHSHDSPRAL